MENKYYITDYFEKNNLFDSNDSKGLIIKNDSKTIQIIGSSRDLIELADHLVNVAISKNEHIHIDDLTLINKESDYKEIIIEKDN